MAVRRFFTAFTSGISRVFDALMVVVIGFPLLALAGLVLGVAYACEWSISRGANATRVARARRDRSEYVLLFGSFSRALDDERATGHVRYEGESP